MTVCVVAHLHCPVCCNMHTSVLQKSFIFINFVNTIATCFGWAEILSLLCISTFIHIIDHLLILIIKHDSNHEYIGHNHVQRVCQPLACLCAVEVARGRITTAYELDFAFAISGISLGVYSNMMYFMLLFEVNSFSVAIMLIRYRIQIHINEDIIFKYKNKKCHYNTQKSYTIFK